MRLPRPPTNRRDATDGTHLIYGAADDESLGDRLRDTVVANGLSGTRCAQAKPPRSPKPRSSKATKGSTRPGVWRTNRAHAVAKVDALASDGLDDIEIPAFLRKQADRGLRR